MGVSEIPTLKTARLRLTYLRAVSPERAVTRREQ
jgi:hypothetical protein